MQAGFMRYGEERILFRAADAALPAPWTDERAAERGIRPTSGLDAIALARLYGRRRPPRSRASRRSGWPTGSARARTGACRAPA